MNAKDTSLTSTSIRRSAWAEQLLGDEPPKQADAATAASPRDAEAEARSRQFFAQVLRNLDRLEKLAAEGDAVGNEGGDGYEWAQLVDPTGTALLRQRKASAARRLHVGPILVLNAASLGLLGAAMSGGSWWPLPASAFAAAAASLSYLRGSRP
jgi:hypothetical protein